MIVIDDGPFELSYMKYDQTLYDHQLDKKKSDICASFESFPGFNSDEVFVISSPKCGFRNRCRFQIQKDLDGKYCHILWENGLPSVQVVCFPIACPIIQFAMRPITSFLNSDSVVGINLSAIHYLSTLSGELLISFIYSNPLPSDWCDRMTGLRDYLKSLNFCHSIDFIGRSKGQKIVMDKNFVKETLVLSSELQFSYFQVDDGFSNPNGAVNGRALSWICTSLEYAKHDYMKNHSSSPFNILEMYCGNGNHTVALSRIADHVLATELNQSLCDAAQRNLALNNVLNVDVLVCESSKFARSIMKRRTYVLSKIKDDKKESVEYHFHCVVVDPPRCGLDIDTCKLVCGWNYILYISCNPLALQRDLEKICHSHRIVRFSIFDQFAYTPHLECGVLLQKIEAS